MKRVIVCLISIVALACATSKEATWTSLSEMDVPYQKAWQVVVNTVSERFEIQSVDSQIGYLKTEWKVTDTCWGGLAFGAEVPCKRERVVVRVLQKRPFRIKLRVEKSEATALSRYRTWVLKGNDKKMEREIIEELSIRLRNL